MEIEKIVVLDFGGGYIQQMARRVRQANVYCEVLPYNASIERIKSINPKGIILAGGPGSFYADNAPRCSEDIYSLNIPILGICYGAQLICHQMGGKVSMEDCGEQGEVDVNISNQSLLFKDMDDIIRCRINCKGSIQKVPQGFRVTAWSDDCPVVAFEHPERKLYGVWFYPEDVHIVEDREILKNFLYNICECSGDWKMSSFIRQTIEDIKNKVGDGKVLCALSGGVDSSVAAVLIHRAVGKQLTCIFVDTGLMRKGEARQVEKIFKDQFDINLIMVDAGKRFLDKLKGVTNPESKRKIIGEEFIRVFEECARSLGRVDYLVQGTIYSDVIESGLGDGSMIKSHHNVGGLPQHIDFKEIIEPLRNLFKDEVREVGRQLGLPDHMVERQPFPGPGLAIRVIGDVTQEKLEILREADALFRDAIERAGLDKKIWQYFAILTGMRSVGVTDGDRTYDYTIALRAVTSIDGTTADWARIPHDVLADISNTIVSKVPKVNRVVYDITSKPPSTIEWE
ncbi:MAG TPA: glutamine-hydrolyzing GMP synthase [Clostridiales bacterium]|nr:glutamine-hydrolyzing GMP synthase [Clostridiales bacterium]